MNEPLCTCTGPARDAHDPGCPVRLAYPRVDLGDPAATGAEERALILAYLRSEEMRVKGLAQDYFREGKMDRYMESSMVAIACGAYADDVEKGVARKR